MKAADSGLYDKFSFSKALFLWIFSYALYLIIAGFASSFYMSNNLDIDSQSIKNSFEYYIEYTSILLPLKIGKSEVNFDRIIISDDMGNIISQTGDGIEGLIKDSRNHYGVAFEADRNGIWISDFTFDLKLEKNVVAVGFRENNTNYTGITDAESFAERFLNSFDMDRNILVLDANKSGYLKAEGKTNRISAFTADKISWLPGSLVKVENNTYFFAEAKLGTYSIYSLKPFQNMVAEYFLPLIIPFVIGAMFILILKLWKIREDGYFNSHFTVLNNMAKSDTPSVPGFENSYSKEFFDCAVSIADLAVQNGRNNAEIKRLTEKSSHLSESLRDTMFKIASLNQFFQKFSISEDYSIRAGLNMLCKIMIESEESLENAEIYMNDEKVFTKTREDTETGQFETITVDYSGMRIGIKLRFYPWVNQQDMMLKIEVIKNTFFTLSIMYALKKENRNDRQTGLMTFEFFSSQMKKEIYELERYTRCGTLLMMSFMKINQILEKYGEATYEKILGKIGKTIKDNIRESDMASKYSIDRILIFFPEITSANCADKGIKLAGSVKDEIQKEFFGIELETAMGISQSSNGEKPLHLMIEECTGSLMKI